MMHITGSAIESKRRKLEWRILGSNMPKCHFLYNHSLAGVTQKKLTQVCYSHERRRFRTNKTNYCISVTVSNQYFLRALSNFALPVLRLKKKYFELHHMCYYFDSFYTGNEIGQGLIPSMKCSSIQKHESSGQRIIVSSRYHGN
jgi:hypothetical protein